jgi:hypothetical protein
LTQEGILKDRESLFQNFFAPAVNDVIQGFDPDSASGKAQMGLTASEINASFDSAQKQTGQALAQRNMTRSGAGLALTAANNRARSSALANAYANQMASSNANKGSTLAAFSSLMPQTTTVAPLEEQGQSTSSSSAVSNAISNATSNSTASSNMVSDSSSESHGSSTSKGSGSNVQVL